MSRKLSGLNATSNLQTMARNRISSVEQSASLKVSVSIKDVINHLDFLKSVEDQGGKFYDATYVKNSLRRYEKFWLPLMLTIAENPDNDTKYAPPLGMLLTYFHNIYRYYAERRNHLDCGDFLEQIFGEGSDQGFLQIFSANSLIFLYFIIQMFTGCGMCICWHH